MIQKKTEELKKTMELNPITISGRLISKTFWGKAWCKNIESYQDYENRLPRGRSYLKHGAVLELKITKGNIFALVLGAELYEVNIKIKPLSKEDWERIKKECAGKIDSLMDLIQGKLSDDVIEVLCHHETGLFPEPSEITLICNCPDYSDLCKHLAATLYGVGARLDSDPALFFTLRGVDQNELFNANIEDVTQSDDDVEVDGDLEALFDIDLDTL
jgi:uncharacterized Zn finger protein